MLRPLISIFLLFFYSFIASAQCPVLINPVDGGIGCITTSETLILINESGVSFSNQTLTKTSNSNGWSAGAASLNKVYNNGQIQTVVDQTNTERVFGLSAANNGNNPNSILYGIHLNSNSTLQIVESGSVQSNAGVYSMGDMLSVRNEDGVIKYYRNEQLLFESAQPPPEELIADFSLRTSGSRLSELKISNVTAGEFTATPFFNLGIYHSYSWSLNGSDFGGNSSGISLNNYEDGDVLTCEIFSVSFGCFGYNVSNSITLHKPASQTVEFYITGLFDSGASTIAEEEVVWNPGSMVNVDATNNTLVKTQGNGWDAGASSFNRVHQNGYLEFIPAETNRRKMIGLSAADANANYNTIGYAFYLLQNGTLRIYENGTNSGIFGTYSSESVLRIAIESGSINYYRDGTLLRSTSVSGTLPFIVDVSMRDVGGTVPGAVVGNLNSGSFMAVTNGAEEIPEFQWALNDLDVGENESAYYNANLYDNDIITCAISFGSSDCSSDEILSNKIRFIGASDATDWTGVVSSAWSNPANWSNGVPDQAISVRIRAGMPHDPQVNTTGNALNIEIESGVEMSFLGTSSLRLFGDIQNNGTFSSGNGVVALSGEGNQHISGNPIRFNRLIVNTTGSSDSIVLHTDVEIADETVFINGIIYTVNQELVYLNGSDSREGLDNSHVEGVCRKIGNTAFRFPTGRNGIYAPIAISSPVQTTDAFTASYFDYDPAEDGFPQALQDGSIGNISQCEYWLLDRVSGTSVVSATLSYQNERSCGITDPNELLVLRWDGSEWRNHGYLAHDGDVLSGSVTSGLPIFEFSPFTLGSGGSAVNPLPIELLDFNATALNDMVLVEWSTLSEVNNDFFTLERSTDGINFEFLGHIEGAGISSLKQSYAFSDDQPLHGVSYYQLSQTDFNGAIEIFPVVMVQYNSGHQAMVYPNPSSGQFLIEFPHTGLREISLYDASGRQLLTESTDATLLEFSSVDLPSGIYFIEVADNLGMQRYKQIIHR